MCQINIFLLLSLLFILFSQINCDLRVKDSGVNKMLRGNVGMVLFVIIENLSTNRYQINVKMIQCTEIFYDNDDDRDSMYLIGGYMGPLYSRSEKTVTLIYPNMYLYNRKGICTIGIYYTNEQLVTREFRTHVKFSTVPYEGIVPEEITDFYRQRPIKQCDSVDLDPLANCRPVDCMMKYSGNKNYFNPRWKRCQKVPICVSNSNRNRPDVAYIPTSNHCRNLKNCITQSDLRLLEQGISANSSQEMLSNRGLIIECYHGCIDNTTGLCECDDGWISADIDIDKYLPGLSHYHMCNIEIDSWNAANRARIRSTILAFTVLAVFITMVVLIITFCLYAVHLYLKDYEGLSPFMDNEDEDDDDEEEDLYTFDQESY